MQTLLRALGLSDEHSIVPFYPRVRDRDDIAVLKCQRSGVLLLSRCDHMDLSHYETQQSFNYWSASDRQAALEAHREDTQRRFERCQGLVAQRKWLDVGTGLGAVLDRLSPLAAQTMAVEPQQAARRALLDLGYAVFPSVHEVPAHDLEVVTLFHVFEHLTDPLGTLAALHQRMAPGAHLVVEVPHARDFLLSFLALESFKAFTFWSEHLILHTRESLQAFIAAAGFDDIRIEGCQRYPLANHLHWLARQQPGGHHRWPHLRTPQLDQAYGELLTQLDATDTLIAVARKAP